MKMKTVIEAGRKAAPLVSSGLSEVAEKLVGLRQLLVDLSAVKSEGGMRAVADECVRCLDSISGSLVDTTSKWRDFEGVLGGYKYSFKKAKTTASRDLPGQQMLFGDNEPNQ